MKSAVRNTPVGTSFIDTGNIYRFGTGLPISMSKDINYSNIAILSKPVKIHCKYLKFIQNLKEFVVFVVFTAFLLKTFILCVFINFTSC